MHTTHGVTIERQAHFDDSNAALNLRRRSASQKLRAGEIAEAARGATDHKGRSTVTLPDTTGECDPELYGKSPQETAEILERRAADEHASTDQLMRSYPGKPNDGAPHSSSGGRRHKKPGPGVDHAKQSYGAPEDPAKFRPHQVGGRISTEALRAFVALKQRGVTPGEVLNLIGEVMYAGVPWAQIEWNLRDLATGQRIA